MQGCNTVQIDSNSTLPLVKGNRVSYHVKIYHSKLTTVVRLGPPIEIELCGGARRGRACFSSVDWLSR